MKQPLLLVAFLCAWTAGAEEPWTVYAAAKTATAPVIDGRFDDPCWQGVERSRPLTCIGGAAAPISTTGMLRWDAKNLYVALSCEEPLLAAVMKRKADGVLAPFAESVEMFFDVDEDHYTYAQLRVDVSGNRDTRPQGGDVAPELEQRWAAAVTVDSGRWTVEAAIPFDLLASRPPDGETVWGLNLNRSRSISPEGAWTCWADTKGPFHAPSNFGHLLFSPYAAYLRGYFAAAFQEAGDGLPDQTVAFLKSLESAPPTDGQAAMTRHARGVALLRNMEEQHIEAFIQATGGGGELKVGGRKNRPAP